MILVEVVTNDLDSKVKQSPGTAVAGDDVINEKLYNKSWDVPEADDVTAYHLKSDCGQIYPRFQPRPAPH